MDLPLDPLPENLRRVVESVRFIEPPPLVFGAPAAAAPRRAAALDAVEEALQRGRRSVAPTLWTGSWRTP